MQPTIKVGSTVQVGAVVYEVLAVLNDGVMMHSQNTGKIKMGFVEVENLFGV